MALTLLEKVLTGSTAEPLAAASRKVQSVYAQVKRANTHAMEWGPGTFATGKGFELLTPAADTQLPDFYVEAKGNNDLDLADIHILGTAGEGVNIIIDEY